MRGTRHLQKLWRSSDVVAAVQRQSQPSVRAFSSAPEVVINQYKAARSPGDDINSTPTNILNNPEHAETTALVDELLSFTRDLMDAPRKEHDTGTIQHVVAFSGGIDSSLVLALLDASKLDGQDESVHAVIGRSSAVPQDQLALAHQVASHIGTPLVEVATSEGTDETYIANEGQACLACKTHLYSALEAVAEHAANCEGRNIHRLYNGTNADDMKDSTRVGLIAARNFHVQSPLVHTTKADVRRAARHLGLPNWNVAASPCLRSRLALGVQATQDHLQRIEAAESFVRRRLNGLISETTNLRVRLLAGNRAMLEVDAEILPHVETHLLSSEEENWQNHFVQTLDFASISARAFRSGSVSRPALPKEEEASLEGGLEAKVAF